MCFIKSPQIFTFEIKVEARALTAKLRYNSILFKKMIYV